jgi:uncharacterized protein (DUF1810 family)
MPTIPADPFNLERFVVAQSGIYQDALRELRAGEKRSHWMWFVFPQASGLGSSSMTQKYAIASRAEAAAYLGHAVLGRRLEECAAALLAVKGRSAEQIMGYPDNLKLKSSMTLFAEVSSDNSLFSSVLLKYFQGGKDARTLELLAKDQPRPAGPGS